MPRLLAAALLSLAAPAQAATCLFNVDGVIHFDGPCDFRPRGGDGSFEMASADGRALAELSVTEPGVAEGWWNGNSGATVADSPVGTLYRDIRDPACWFNATATFCAW